MPAKERRSGNESVGDKMVASFQHPCEGRSPLTQASRIDNELDPDQPLHQRTARCGRIAV
jgi:hypothetical protein